MNNIKTNVDRLFENAAPWRGRLCENPVTGGYWLPGDDSISHQKRMACRALLAREWFFIYGPHDAPPLPLSDAELDALKYKDPLSHIVSCFADSLRAHNWDFNSHPSFEDFARGCMASEHAPNLLKKAEALRKRHPPRSLRGLGPGLCWQSDQ